MVIKRKIGKRKKGWRGYPCLEWDGIQCPWLPLSAEKKKIDTKTGKKKKDNIITYLHDQSWTT